MARIIARGRTLHIFPVRLLDAVVGLVPTLVIYRIQLLPRVMTSLVEALVGGWTILGMRVLRIMIVALLEGWSFAEL